MCDAGKPWLLAVEHRFDGELIRILWEAGCYEFIIIHSRIPCCLQALLLHVWLRVVTTSSCARGDHVHQLLIWLQAML